MDVYPLTFGPIYKQKIWGGRSLQRLFGRQLPAGKIGESWELADLAEGVSVVANGPAVGTTLMELTQRWGPDLLGGAAPLAEGRFPLLLKLLDANDILSLQVHPDAAAAAAIGPEATAKTECWYILDSRGGYIYKGVAEGVSAEQFALAIETETVERLVRRINVSAGDFHYMPAGTVHALGPGVVVAEVQTPSDTTYRVTDWGRGRDIHVKRSMQCIRFAPSSDAPPGAEGNRLLGTPFFNVDKLCAGGPEAPVALEAGQCAALMFVAGSGTVAVDCGGGRTHEFRIGDTVLVPAAVEAPAVRASADCTFLKITFPESQ